MIFDSTGIILLALVILGGFVAGIGGPGGLIVILSILYTTPLDQSLTAGTSSTLFFIEITLASIAYVFSGEVDWKVVSILVVTTIFGTYIGVQINSVIDIHIFETLISILLFTMGVLFVYRQYKGLDAKLDLTYHNIESIFTITLVGFIVSLIGGVTGFGGPGLTIPVLILIGVPMIEAIGSGFVHGIFVSSTTSFNYIYQSKVDFELVSILMLPMILGLIMGWVFVHRADSKYVKLIIGSSLVAAAPILLVI